jgi:hypothetical protein
VPLANDDVIGSPAGDLESRGSLDNVGVSISRQGDDGGAGDDTLSSEREFPVAKFQFEALDVNRFGQTRTNVAVHFYGGIQNSFRHRIERSG